MLRRVPDMFNTLHVLLACVCVRLLGPMMIALHAAVLQGCPPVY